MTSSVLVTGTSGFIGSYLVRELHAAGHRVTGIDLQPPGPAARFVQGEAAQAMGFISGSVEQWSIIVDAIEQLHPDAIVHNASLVRPDLLSRAPMLALRANVETTLTVLEAARILGVPRIVYMSSIGVLPPARYRPIDANHPVITSTESTPDTFYGAAKIASEAFAFAYHRAFGTDVIVIRPSAVYGFGMNWPIYVKPMVENSFLGLPTRFETGADMPRDYTHVADVARMTCLCVEIAPERVRDRIFHCGTGREPVTAGEVAQTVRELIPGADISIGPGLAQEEVVDAATRGRFDMAGAREQLGFEPAFGDIRAGIADYVDWLRRFRAASDSDQ